MLGTLNINLKDKQCPEIKCVYMYKKKYHLYIKPAYKSIKIKPIKKKPKEYKIQINS
jgi:hypothetical protein